MPTTPKSIHQSFLASLIIIATDIANTITWALFQLPAALCIGLCSILFAHIFSTPLFLPSFCFDFYLLIAWPSLSMDLSLLNGFSFSSATKVLECFLRFFLSSSSTRIRKRIHAQIRFEQFNKVTTESHEGARLLSMYFVRVGIPNY